MDREAAFSIAANAFARTDTFVRAVFSGRRRNFQPQFERVDIRPVRVKEELMYQQVVSDGRATTATNFLPADYPFQQVIDSGYANVLVETTTERIAVRIAKKGDAFLSRESINRDQVLDHDRKKTRLLDAADAFLIEVGISDASGKVKPSRQDKYRQIEEFLRLLEPPLRSAIQAGHIPSPTMDRPLRIVDLGCGGGYLTFATHQYFQQVGLPVRVTGVDIRPDLMERNNAIAEKLGISATIRFETSAIDHFGSENVDVALALHACDTATDDALSWAVVNHAALILAAPCCHHDLQTQMSNPPGAWGAVTRHGLLKERLGDILTDAFRTQILKLLGYRVEAIEFVGGEHTPRNLMIRAVRTGAQPSESDVNDYRSLISQWQVKPALAKRVSDFLRPILG